MKRVLAVVLIISVLLLSACAGGKVGVELETDYDLTTEIIEEENKARYTLNGYDGVLTLYYERPYFTQKGEGLSEINRYFNEAAKLFFESENVSSAVEFANGSIEADYEAGYIYTNTSDITFENERLISVTIAYEWYMGGVLDYGTISYVFDKTTGKILKLGDITGLTDEELKAAILECVAEELPEGDISYIENYTANQFEFAVEEDGIYINFDKYEASYGAAGAFHIKTPFELKY